MTKEQKKEFNIKEAGGVDQRNPIAVMEDKMNKIFENYELKVGFEIHAQLNTKAKLFSSAPLMIQEEANVMANYVDMAMPGALPVLNSEALKLALKACVAFDGQINKAISFERKHYFYNDQPQGY